jgi:phasin
MTEATIAAGLPKVEMPKFDLPKIEMSAAFCELADKGVAQAKENYEKIHAIAEEMTAVLEQTCVTASTGIADYNRKLIEMASASSQVAFEFAFGLIATKSLPQIVELSTDQARKQFDLVTAQNKELWALAGRMATHCAEPIKQGMTKAFDKAIES